jgi:hypothetical protein
VHGQTHVQRSGGFKAFVLFKFSGWGSQKKQQNSTVNRFETFAAVKSVGPDCFTSKHAKVKRTGSFPDKAEEDAPDVSLQGRIPRRYAL